MDIIRVIDTKTYQIGNTKAIVKCVFKDSAKSILYSVAKLINFEFSTY